MSRHTSRVWFGRPGHANNTTIESTRSAKRPTKGQTELAVVFEKLPSYRKYTAGEGPRLKPITLLPVRDSTAYIREEFFLSPSASPSGNKRLQYVIGWTDLPAARLVVDAERIADYVSPAAYEEWCAARAAERDEEERRKEEEENVRAVAEAEAREKEEEALRNEQIIDTGNYGKRKRRTKAEMEADAAATTSVPRAVTPQVGEKRKPGRPRKNAPSLSTPSKARLDDFAELDAEVDSQSGNSIDVDADEDEEDDDSMIYQQLLNDRPDTLAKHVEHPAYSTSDSESYSSKESRKSDRLEHLLIKRRRLKSPSPGISRPAHDGIVADGRRSTSRLDSSRGGTSPLSLSLPPLRPATASQAAPSSRPVSSFNPPVPQASVSHTSTPPVGTRTAAQPPRRSLLTVTHASSRPVLPPRPPPKKETPVPIPLPAFAKKTTAILPPQRGSSAPTKAPVPVPGLPELRETPVRIPRTTLSKRETPIPLPQRQLVPSTAPPILPSLNGTKPPPTTTTTTTAANLSTPTPAANPSRTFTPLSQSKIPWSSPRPQTSPPPLPAHDQQSIQSCIVVDPDRDELAEDMYEVLRLEGLQLRYVRGKPVRFFAVRWKGDWAPEQNPTWEPERNIPRYLTKRYLAAHPLPKNTPTLENYFNTSWNQRKYSSVSEAFEGRGEEETAAAAAAEQSEEDEIAAETVEAQGDEMLVVTDEPQPAVKPTLSW